MTQRLLRPFVADERHTCHIRTKVRITKSEISMRTWRSPMSATSQGAFVVIPEISLCDISYIMTKPRSDTRPAAFIVPQFKPQSYDFILLPSWFFLLILPSFCTRTGTASARSSPRACHSCRKHESELCRSTLCPACLLYWCRSSFSS